MAAPTFDAIGAGAQVGQGTAATAESHTLGPTANCLLVWADSVTLVNGDTPTCVVGATPMTLLGVINYYSASGIFWQGCLLGLMNPPTGSQTITFTRGGSGSFTGVTFNSVSYTGVGSIGTPVNVTGGPSTSLSQPSVASATGRLLTQAFFANTNVAATAYNQTSRWNVSGAGNFSNAVTIGDSPGAATVSFSETNAGNPTWGGLAVDLLPLPDPVFRTSLAIPNRYVGPMALRRSFRRAQPSISPKPPLILSPAPAVLTLTGSAPADSLVLRDPATGYLTYNGRRFRFSGANIANDIGCVSQDNGNPYGATVHGTTYLTPHTQIDAALDSAELMNTSVLRLYSAVQSVGEVDSIQPTLGSFNSAAMDAVDYALYQCGQRGIKVMLPLVDEYSGRSWYVSQSVGGATSQFYTHATVITAFKAFITYVLDHVNTYTGVALKDDPTILAWETGNELTNDGLTDAQINTWTDTISQHIKVTKGARQLVADGHFGITGDWVSYNTGALSLTYVDMYSTHSYDNFRTPKNVALEAAAAHSFGKAFFIGEYTWTDRAVSGGGLAWDVTRMLSCLEGTDVIDGDLFWELLAPGTIWYGGFSVHRPEDGTCRIPNPNFPFTPYFMPIAEERWRGGELLDHATAMAGGVARIILMDSASSSFTTQSPSVTFSSTNWTPQAGDVVAMWCTFANSGGIAVPAGWSNPLGANTVVDIGTHTQYCVYHVVTSGEQTAGTLTYGPTNIQGNLATSIAAVVLRGVDLGNIVDSAASASNSSSVTPHVVAGLTGSNLVNDSLVLSSLAPNGTQGEGVPDSWGQATWTQTTRTLWLYQGNARTDAGVNVSSANVIPSSSSSYSSITVAFTASLAPITPTAAALTVTGSTPRLNLTLRPAGASLTLTGAAPAPTVIDGGNATSAGSDTVDGGSAGSIGTDEVDGGNAFGPPPPGTSLKPAGVALTLTGSAPQVSTVLVVRPFGALLTFTQYGPFIRRDQVTGNLLRPDGTRFRFSGANCSTLGNTAANSAYGAPVDADGLHLPTHSEIDDTLAEAVSMNATVIRGWASVSSVGKINAVQPTLGVFNAAALEPIDYLLQQCRSLGIKLYFPLVDNYQYEINGKYWYCTANSVTPDGDATQFFSNSTIVTSFKAHITYVLNHVNAYTGVAYKNDPTILAWETGNELTASGLATATMDSWISGVAAHIKTTVGARQLVMDGSYGLGDPPPINRLEMSQVDIYSDHTYDNFRYPTYLDNEGSICHAYGKAFVVGEYTWNGNDTGGSGLDWGLSEMLSQISSSPNIDGDSYWALLASLETGDAFTVHWPAGTNEKISRANQLADHAAEMTSRTRFGPRIVAQQTGSTTNAATRGVTFNSGADTYRPELDDLLVLFGGNNSTPPNGAIATAPGGWFNPLGAGVGVSSDTHTLGVFCHWVTAAEQEAGTVTYSATMYTASSWGDSMGIVVRGVDKGNPIVINTAFNSGNTTTPHVLAGLTGSGLSNEGLVVSSVVSNGANTYINPLTTWGVLGFSNTQQGMWTGVLNRLTDAGVNVSATNITPSTGDEYASITMAFNPAPAISQTAFGPVRNQTVAMGDSITDYGGNHDYQPWIAPIYLNQLHIMTKQRMRYGGVYATGGLHMTQIRDTHLPQVLGLAPKPGAAILFVGTNDCANPINYVQHIFKGMVAQLLDAGIAPILVTIMPRDDAPTFNGYVAVWNTFIHQFAAANGFSILDAHTAVSDPDGTYKSGYTSDGLHPTQVAYQAIAQQGIDDGLPSIFPALSEVLTLRTGGDLSNLFNDGTSNLGLFSTDSNADGIANGLTLASTSGAFSLVTPLTGDLLAGNWQQLRHSTTGLSIALQRTITGFIAGQVLRFSCRVQTENMTSTATPWYLELAATVPGGYTYPDGGSGTTVKLGAEAWSADTDGLFYVNFKVPTGTTTLVFTAAMDGISGGEDPKLRIGELTITPDNVFVPIAASLTVTGSTPRLGLAVRPTGATLTLTGGTPVIIGGNNQLVTPTGASLALTGSAPRLDLTLRPTAGALTVTGSAPLIVNPQSAIPSGGSLAIAGSAPRLDLTLRPAGATLALTGAAPGAPQTFAPAATSLALTGSAPRLDLTLRPAVATLTVTGSAPVVVNPQTVTPGGSALSLTGGTPSLGATVTPSAAALSLTGSTPTVLTPQTFQPGGLALGLTGGSPLVKVDLAVAPTAASLTLTGSAPRLDLTVRPAGATLALAGGAPTIAGAQVHLPLGGSLTLTGGTPVVLTPQTFAPAATSLTLTGSAPRLDFTLRPAGASLVVTGSAPRLDFTLRPAGASLVVTGSAPMLDLTLRSAAASLALTGGTPAAQLPVLVTPSAATLALFGSVPTIAVPQQVRPTGSTLALTGSTPNVVLPVLVTPGAATLALSSSVPIVAVPQQVLPIGAALVLTSATPGVALPVLVTPGAVTLALFGSVPMIVNPRQVWPIGVTLALTGSTPDVALPVLATPGGAGLVLTTAVPTLFTPQTFMPNPVLQQLVGASPFVTSNNTQPLIFPAPGSITLSGGVSTIVGGTSDRTATVDADSRTASGGSPSRTAVAGMD